jgi:hypothetical protein
MKDDVNDGVPNGTPKTLIPSDGMINLDGVLKLSSKLKVTMLHISKVKWKFS